MYITVDLADDIVSTAVGVERVFNFLHRMWFRDDEAHLEVGNFFGRAVRCWETGGLKRIEEIVEAHRVICERVKEMRADGDVGFEGDGRPGGFVMKRSYERCFVVVDQGGWWEKGVVLVRSDRAKEREGEEVKGEWPVFGVGDEGWAIRIGLGEVVDLIRGIEENRK